MQSQQKPKEQQYFQPRYAKRDHYSYHVAHVPEQNGNKMFIYYKRYTPKGKLLDLIEGQDTLYEAFENFKNCKIEDQQHIIEQEKICPISRTLIVINFDHQFQEEKIKKWFQLIGKVRKVDIGSYKNKNNQSKAARTIYFALIVFKNEFDMIRVFSPEHLQTKFNEFFKHQKLKQTNDDKGAYLSDLLNKYENKELEEMKQKEIDKLRQEGFNIVTDYKGDIQGQKKTLKDLERENEINGVKQKNKTLPYIKNDFYKFQNKKRQLEDMYGQDNIALTGEQYLKRKKKQLMAQFQQDKEQLQKTKFNKTSQ
ncbi:hypothetical protein PPERSA_11228 [Pseudocohnilembus persalinus]|uniref:Ribosomal RNA-processing protein 7 C-terminal domain-containing protein n=1 Tax=Pseudocohnilembus persalinus TaxID=266149 RepID=A0A0V0QZD5_PSEPJ|nr:hypothetical protein PPERSA_11228 [Pseudocohnilembus persalinus]|eukprot:KRX07679.1 hypothetical protein PPERSA_11228 [Pseudocohnilembus persalinus]